ncbi:hypothetical protein [Halanaerobium hydrogeniformans]|uniref:HMA domain-containing protein n=1 Tax=Halanaerobium hydrogeniformans TaxID=656519 RepID=E4RMI5_HALHG|nr:hypothetical protein [Halanaerobium hydrogeniformans]ADQ14516.1 hypothetical protein Halsa_1082 [Halanaerobium hydrogeniformans]
MSKQCGDCNCEHRSNFADKADQSKTTKNRNRKYSVKYRVKLNNLECDEDQFIERIKSYQGIVDEVEFTEEELIISYDDRLISPSEIEKIVS